MMFVLGLKVLRDQGAGIFQGRSILSSLRVSGSEGRGAGLAAGNVNPEFRGCLSGLLQGNVNPEIKAGLQDLAERATGLAQGNVNPEFVNGLKAIGEGRGPELAGQVLRDPPKA